VFVDLVFVVALAIGKLKGVAVGFELGPFDQSGG